MTRGESQCRASRRLLNLLTVLSLLLCAAVVVLWVRARHYGDIASRVWLAQDASSASSAQWTIGTGYDGVRIIRIVMRRSNDNEGVEVFREMMESEASRGWVFETGEASQSVDLSPQVRMYAVTSGGHGALLGLQYLWVSRQPESAQMLKMPFWLLFAVSTVLPAHWGLTTVSARGAAARRKSSLCPRCGYDLRATPGRCPECGATASVIEKA